MNKKTIFGLTQLLFLLLLLLLPSACGRGDDTPKIDFTKTTHEQKEVHHAEETPLKIAVSAIISPKETFIYYKEMLNYISRRAGRPVQLVLRETYKEVNDLIEKEEIDMAFVCSGAYVDGHRDFGMELLAAPMAYGKTTYNSYIIVHKESSISTLEGLRGKSFAFTDPMSNTGHRAPLAMLTAMNETPESFFSKTTYTYSHDRSIEAVADRLVDGAAVDSLVWEYLNHNHPAHTARTKVVKISVPYGIPPVVAPKGLDAAFKEQLRSILLTMHEDEEGRAILAHIMIDRFVPVSDNAYDSIRSFQVTNGQSQK